MLDYYPFYISNKLATLKFFSGIKQYAHFPEAHSRSHTKQKLFMGTPPKEGKRIFLEKSQRKTLLLWLPFSSLRWRQGMKR